MAVIQPSRILNRKNILLLADLIKSLLHLQYISLSSQTNFQLYLTTKILWMKGCTDRMQSHSHSTGKNLRTNTVIFKIL